MSKSSLRSILLGAATVIAAPTLSVAQTQSLDEIIVTAQKRAESANDVPVSLAVYGGDALNDNVVVNVEDLAQFIPNLEIATPNGTGIQPAIFLRGVGINDFNTNNNGPIAIYADEVYRSSFVAQGLNLYDVERLEVLKGPQGTLFGRNATGGAIRAISRKPGDTFAVRGELLYSSFDTTRLEGAVNVPLGEKAAFRLAGVKADSDGFLDDVGNGIPTGGYDTASWRAQLDLDLTDSFNTLFAAEGIHTRNPGAGLQFQGVLDAAGAPCSVADIQSDLCFNPVGDAREPDRFDVNYDQTGFTDFDAYILSNTSTLSLGNFEIVSVTAYETIEDFDKLEDTDVSPSNIVEARFGVESETFSQELRLGYSGDRLQGTVGVFYLDESLDQNQSADLFRDFRPLIESIDPVAFPSGFDPAAAAIGVPSFILDIQNRQETETFAIFGQGEYALTDQFSLIGGLRYTDESRSFDTLGRAIDALRATNVAVTLYDQPLEVDNENVSFKVGGSFETARSDLLYATVSTGFKSGGFNGGFPTSPAEVGSYDEETLTAYEVGGKFGLRNAQLNMAAFYYDYEDIQVFTFDNSGLIPITVLTNGGDASILGFEADLIWQPTDELTVNGALGVLDTEFTSGVFDGNRLPLSPEFSLTAGATYEWPAFGGDLAVNASIAYKTDVFYDPTNSALFAQDDYALVDGFVRYKAGDDILSVSLFVENLFKQNYEIYAVDFSSFGYNQRALGAPRSFGVRLGFDY
ncbi:MAG: TonB-dependent receptor [Pseudomonadota bacterium]